MRTIWLAVIAALALATSAAAQYPSRPVRIVVTIPPGGAPDIVARVIGERLAPALGQPVVIENRPGSNGNIAAELVARSAPDGHTLLLSGDSLFVINPHLYRRMPVDVRRELVPVAPLASANFILSVNPALPVSTLQEFIEYARRADPPLAYASGGNGTQHHLTMERLKQRAGIPLLHVPFKGGAPATAATVAGETAAMFASTSSLPQIRAGRLRALAVTGATRLPAFPELPALREVFPGFEMTVWLALFAPEGTAQPVLARLREALAAILAAPEVREHLERAGGLRPLLASPALFAAMIERDAADYAALIERIGLRID